MIYQKQIGTLCAADQKGAGNQYVNDSKVIVMKYPAFTLRMRGGCEGGG